MPSTALPQKRLLSFDDEGDDSADSGDDAGRTSSSKTDSDALASRRHRGITQTPLLDEAATAKARAAEEQCAKLESMLMPAKQAKKSFAWMDSDDDDGDNAAAANASVKDSDAKAAADALDSQHHQEVSASGSSTNEMPRSIRSITTFGELMRASEGLRASAATLPFEDVVVVCEVSARIKFFDTELMDSILPPAVGRITSGAGEGDQLLRMASALVDLNACSEQVSKAIAVRLLPEVAHMSKQLRLQWLKLLPGMTAGRNSAENSSEDSFETALRMAPLPTGDSASDDFLVCWDYARGGFCPRGKNCKWAHRRDKDSSAPEAS